MAIDRSSANALINACIPYISVNKQVIDISNNPDTLAIWVYLISKPSDWVVRSSDIERKFNIGRVRRRAAYKQLEELGLLTYVRTRDENGKLSGRAIRICDILTEGSIPDASTDSLVDKRPPYKETDLLQRKELIQKEDFYFLEDKFEEFWSSYPATNKGNKQAAKKSFVAKVRKHGAEVIEAIGNAIALQTSNFNRVKMLNEFHPNFKHFSTWLNQECWNDELYKPEVKNNNQHQQQGYKQHNLNSFEKGLEK